MGYYNNDRNGYNNRGYDRRGGYDRRDNYDRGYDRGGYDRRGNYDRGYDRPDFPYEIGQKVIHKATGLELSVINYGREQLECRKPDLGTVWCYVHELAPLPGEENNQ